MVQPIFILTMLIYVINSTSPKHAENDIADFVCYTQKKIYKNITDVGGCQNLCRTDADCVTLHYSIQGCSIYSYPQRNDELPVENVICLFGAK